MSTNGIIPDNLLVSGPNGGGLALVKNDRVFSVSSTSVTGVAVGSLNLAWCLQSSNAASEIVVMTGGKLATHVVDASDLDLHDLSPVGDGWQAAATMANAVLQLDRSGCVVKRWDFGGEPDSMHLNSLCRHDGRLLASAFGRFTEHRGYKGRTRGAGLVLDVDSGETFADGLSQPHSLVSSGDWLYFCDSEVGEVVRRGPGGKEERATLPGYTRGLCVAGERIYVGVSRSRNQSERSIERFATAVVAVLRADTLEVTGYVPLEWDEIYDVRAIERMDQVQGLLMLALDTRAEGARALGLGPPAVDVLARQLAEVESRIVVAISDDIRTMQDAHSAMASAAERAQTELESQRARADRAEQFGRWAATAWGTVTEQRQAMEALTDAVIVMEQRLAAAIGDEIRRMQDVHSEVMKSAGHLEGELSATREALVAEQSRNVRAEAAAEHSRASYETIVEAFAGYRRDMEQRDEVARERISSLEAAHGAAEAARLRLLEQLERAEIESEAVLTRQALEFERHFAEAEAARLKLAKELEDYAAEAEAVRFAQAEAFEQQLKEAEAFRLQQVKSFEGRIAESEALRSKQAADYESRLADADLTRSRQEAELAQLRVQAERLAQIHGSLSWRVTRPVRFAVRLARHGLGRDERSLLADWIARSRWAMLPASTRLALARRLKPHSSQPVSLLPASGKGPSALPELAPSHEMPDVFFWAVIDWHFRTQRPQHLARALAEKGHRVFYISNVLMDSDTPGFAIDDLDGAGRLFQVHLNVRGAPSIYNSQPEEATAAQIAGSVASLLEWTQTRRSVSIVQHPYWTFPAQFVPNARLVYDCMDHHAGFGNNTASALAHEEALVQRADLVVTTSAWLEKEMASHGRQVALVRNATDFDHFRDPPTETYRDPKGRRVIGYIGAIAEWFDVDTVRAVAEAHADCAVVLVGADTINAASRLSEMENVSFIGEVPYAALPYWLHGFDVCLLPFRVIPLTLATNPVKIYEYLSAAKPVVAIDLPEMAQFAGLVEVAGSPESFAEAVGRALRPVVASVADERRAFASCQTWAHRAAELDAAIARVEEPKVSVVVLTYNNLSYTDACLFSIEAYSDYPDLEVIVVDNGSTDGTPEYLRKWVEEGENRRIILNRENRGFAAGNNQGLEAATGEFLIMLNNDTYVTPGWVRTLVGHLRRDPSIGIVGPVTNNIGNEACIDIGYRNMEEMIERAGRYTRAHAGGFLQIPVVAFFCAMLPRRVFEHVGPLDEAFGCGFFEDDDYCRRISEAGWQVVCAEDVFVHHHLSASFEKLSVERRQELFERNRAIFEAKWGEWSPHRYRA